MENFERPAFPCALIAGDVVILNLLDKLGYLSSGKVPVIFIDTFHLFPETHDLMHRLEVCAFHRCGLCDHCTNPKMIAYRLHNFKSVKFSRRICAWELQGTTVAMPRAL